MERVEQDPLRLVGGVELRRQLGEAGAGGKFSWGAFWGLSTS